MTLSWLICCKLKVDQKGKGVFKGGGGGGLGVSPPLIFLKSEGKEIERKKGRGGGSKLFVNIFLGVEIFSSVVEIFSWGLIFQVG